jgi:hypothetical protein
LLDNIPNEPSHCYNFNNISRYDGVIEYCKTNFKYVDTPDDCDVIVLPYKFINTNDPIYEILCTISQTLNKELWCFYNDDNDSRFNIPNNVRLFRTSFYYSSRKQQEYSLIAFSPDYYDNKIIDKPDLSIGYCGHTMHGRNKYLSLLSDSDVKTNFIVRKGFWAPGIDKRIARKEYFENIETNIFTFCYRGGGNFSYRFYEILMMGRIPILINTDCVFPFWNEVKKNNIGLIIEGKKIMDNTVDLITEIKNYYNKYQNDLIDIQKTNRKIWEIYYSPIGFLNNIKKPFL